MNFADDVGADFYIDDVDEYNEAAHEDGSNTLSDEAYGDMMTEERPEKDNIDDAAYNKYVGAAVMMGVAGVGPS